MLIALLESSGATIYQATPVRYRMLLDAGWKGMPHLQLLCGGEKLARELADQLLHALRHVVECLWPNRNHRVVFRRTD